MFGLFKPKKSFDDETSALHDVIMEQSLLPEFYMSYGVPDTLDGRYEMFALHLSLLANRLADDAAYADFSQELYDKCFRNIDKGLREAGIGDMSVPKHMKRMMKGFNGRVHAYSEGLTKGASVKVLDAAIERNIYGTLQSPKKEHVRAMRAYIKMNAKALAAQPLNDMMNGSVTFKGA